MIGGIRKALLRVDFRCSAEEPRAFWAGWILSAVKAQRKGRHSSTTVLSIVTSLYILTPVR